MNVCLQCFIGNHCFGKYDECQCECRAHTFSTDDARFKFISMLTAVAHDDSDLVQTALTDMTAEDLVAVTIYAAKYAVWMARTAGMDPIEMVQQAALYWSGGTSDPDTSNG